MLKISKCQMSEKRLFHKRYYIMSENENIRIILLEWIVAEIIRSVVRTQKMAPPGAT
jgi:hypothetical protein